MRPSLRPTNPESINPQTPTFKSSTLLLPTSLLAHAQPPLLFPPLQGYLAHANPPLPRTLQQDYTTVPMVVPGGGAVSCEPGTPAHPLSLPLPHSRTQHLPDIEQWSQSSGSNVIPRRVRPGLHGPRPHAPALSSGESAFLLQNLAAKVATQLSLTSNIQACV